MKDLQIDKIKEIESIAELMSMVSDSISKESSQNLGLQILEKCKKIVEMENNNLMYEESCNISGF